MKNIFVTLSSIAILLASGDALGQEREGAVGVGIESTLAGAAGPALVVQTPAFHVEGILAFADQGDETDLILAGRFWYAINQTQRSDFSVGGGIGLLFDDNGGGDNDTDVELDLGAQLRAFLVPNVALSVSLGFVFVSTAGPNPLALTGDLLASGGIAYFF